jgi:hypothetical protein
MRMKHHCFPGLFYGPGVHELLRLAGNFVETSDMRMTSLLSSFVLWAWGSRTLLRPAGDSTTRESLTWPEHLLSGLFYGPQGSYVASTSWGCALSL